MESTRTSNREDTQMTPELLAEIVGTYQAQDVLVSYEDMANPRRVGQVVEHRAGEFRVVWNDDDGGETWSDLRQAGWRRESTPTASERIRAARDGRLSESFTDSYGTRFTLRMQEGHEHVQLLMTYADGSEQTSYGFTVDDFQFFCKAAQRLAEQIEATA